MASKVTLDHIGPARLIRLAQLIKKERGVWVCQGEWAGASIVDLNDRQRNRRLRELAAFRRDRAAREKR